ncbi:MAG: transporter [Burkholderiaceae bacterium]|nr:transporter [Burkholderiaceae bacterium]
MTRRPIAATPRHDARRAEARSAVGRSTPRRFVHRPALAASALMLLGTAAPAQELEPRAYSNAPVGFNFLVVGYGRSQGGLSFDPALPIEDAKLKIDSAVFAYARTLDLWGKSGRFDVVLPYSHLSGSAMVAGQPAERQITGFSEPRFRLSVNLYGAPALSLQEFSRYQRDLVVGTSLQVSLPSGQYDPSRAINLGSHRWTVKPDIGFSKAFGAATLDVTASATFYGDNSDYYGGQTLEQAPLYATQAHLSWDFGGGIWAALGGTYYRGSRVTINGNTSLIELGNSHAGAMLALPVDRHQSVKFSLSSSIKTRTGSDLTAFAMAWQVRWGAGY